MSRYYVNTNAQTNGDHEVHVTGCNWLPAQENRKYPGDFSSCRPAVIEAKKNTPNQMDVTTVAGIAIHHNFK